jgi:serine/threonine protein kinase
MQERPQESLTRCRTDGPGVAAPLFTPNHPDVTLYETLTSVLPFTASDPMEWVHCHVAGQQQPLSERPERIPEPVSIVSKLLAKTAEEHYQTAAGVEADFRRCVAEWESHGRIDPFPLGAQDASGRLMIPERLYVREREIEALLEGIMSSR